MGFIVNHCNNMAVTTPDSIKFTYFDLRVKGEAARLLLAYGGLQYEDERVTLPWDDITQWKTLKPSMPYGQLPCLTWNGEKICQSMAICRFLAREMNIAGRNSVEKRLVERGGQFMVGNNFTWADLHLFYFCSEDFICPSVLQNYPKLSNLVSRVGAMPNIKKWMDTRPANGTPQKGFMIYFKNAYKILVENLA